MHFEETRRLRKSFKLKVDLFFSVLRKLPGFSDAFDWNKMRPLARPANQRAAGPGLLPAVRMRAL